MHERPQNSKFNDFDRMLCVCVCSVIFTLYYILLVNEFIFLIIIPVLEKKPTTTMLLINYMIKRLTQAHVCINNIQIFENTLYERGKIL